MKEELKKIRSLIADNELKIAFKLAGKILEGHPKENLIINLNGQHKSLEQQFDLSTIEFDDYLVAKNKISSGFLNSINDIIEFEDKYGNNISTPNKPASSKELLEEMLDDLEMAYSAFRTQLNLRDKLAKAICQRTNEIVDEEYWEFFLRHYELGFTVKEQIQHQGIRGITSGMIRKYNFKVLTTLEENPKLKDVLPNLVELHQHLEHWELQYQTSFLNNEGISLVYLREIDKGFPRNIERMIRKKIMEL